MGTTMRLLPGTGRGAVPAKSKLEDQMVVSVGPYTLRKLLLPVTKGIKLGRNASPPTYFSVTNNAVCYVGSCTRKAGTEPPPTRRSIDGSPSHPVASIIS